MLWAAGTPEGKWCGEHERGTCLSSGMHVSPFHLGKGVLCAHKQYVQGTPGTWAICLVMASSLYGLSGV